MLSCSWGIQDNITEDFRIELNLEVLLGGNLPLSQFLAKIPPLLLSVPINPVNL